MNLLKYKPEKLSWKDIGEILGFDRSYAYNIAKFPHKHGIDKVKKLGKFFGLSEDKIKDIWTENKIETETARIKEAAN